MQLLAGVAIFILVACAALLSWSYLDLRRANVEGAIDSRGVTRAGCAASNRSGFVLRSERLRSGAGTSFGSRRTLDLLELGSSCRGWPMDAPPSARTWAPRMDGPFGGAEGTVAERRGGQSRSARFGAAARRLHLVLKCGG